MARGIRKWSKTAASNATADSGVNWAEAMAPSAVNDSARAEMASAAMWRDDNNGSLVGTLATATYSVTSNQTFDAYAAGDTIAFQLGSAMPATALLNVDSLGAKPLRPTAGTDFAGGEYVANQVIRATYFTSNSGEWIVAGAAKTITSTIVDGAVTNAKLADMAASTLKGRATSSTGAPEDVTLGAGLAMSGTALVLSQTLAPQGRLTLTSGVPILNADASAQSTIYYTPYAGNLLPIYDGSVFSLISFSQLSMVMSGANFAANGIYDLFVASDSGTTRLAIGPVWATTTAGSGARGSGAGTTELELKSGIWTNKNSITLRYASGSTFTAAANRATCVGSLLMDGTNSQVSCHVTYGQSRKYGVWNAYNRIPISLLLGDGTASWTYSTGTIRQSRADANNTMAVFCGLAEEPVRILGTQAINGSSAGAGTGQIGVGLNVTNAFSGTSPASVNATISVANCDYTLAPFIGVNNINFLEKSGGTATQTWLGTEASMRMTATYRG